jgi:hypothetical protein
MFKIGKLILAAILLVLFQVVVMDSMYMSLTILPCIYIYFILILPLKTPNWLLFVLAFLIGLSVDIFMDTLGINALASLIMALGRFIFLLKIDIDKAERNNVLIPSSNLKHRNWYLGFVMSLIMIHHFVLFVFYDWSISNFFETLIVMVISSLSTLLFVLIFDVIFYKDKV